MRRNQNLKIAFCVFLSILVVALGPVYGGRSNGSISETFQKVAKAGSAATVGIYFSQSEFVSYYGTGVVISPDGYILTSTTVIPPEAEKTILIYFADHSRREATLVESATQVEASLLKVDADELPYVPLAETLPELGERAYTFGNARHMLRRSAQASFSAGRITGIYDVGSASGLSSYEGLAIETDAAINPGQDGGPLLDSEGKLAGIVSLSFSDARWLGVAVPTFKIKKALNSLADGSVKTSETPLVNPPADDIAAGEDFLGAARNIVPALVKLDIKRKHPLEEMPRYHWPRFIAEHQDKWNNASKAEKAQLANVFFHAEKILRANQQVRRPDAPVTGALISADGYILTSAFNVAVDLAFVHKKKGIQPISFDEWSLSKLIGNPRNYRKQRNPVEKITAILSDGRTLPAKVISHHKPLRIALLKIEADDLPHLDLNTETDAIALGRQAAVVGVMEGKRPFTLNPGVVSASSRQSGRFFQFGGTVNFANSGGPVIDRKGRFLGITAEPLRPGPVMGMVLQWRTIAGRWYSAPNSGISFVSRIDHIKKDIGKMKSGQSIERIRGAFIGIAMDQKKAFSEGAFVGAVIHGSPAEAAGLKKGDQILAVEGRKINSWKELTDVVQSYEVGDRITLKVQRLREIYQKEIEGGTDDENENEAEGEFDLENAEDDDLGVGQYKTLSIPLTLGERE